MKYAFFARNELVPWEYVDNATVRGQNYRNLFFVEEFMNKNMRPVCLALAAAFVFVLAADASAQRSTVLGGYKAAKTTDADVKAAAEFAVTKRAETEEKEMELASVLKAERQSVAGTNYRLCLKVDSEGGEGQDAVTIFVQAIVYKDLKGNYKLSSWTISECGDNEE